MMPNTFTSNTAFACAAVVQRPLVGRPTALQQGLAPARFVLTAGRINMAGRKLCANEGAHLVAKGEVLR